MTTFDQKIQIPENRHVSLKLHVPENVPIGEANIQVTITPVIPPKKGWDALMKFHGIFKDDPAFQGNSVDIQRKMRDE
ncbi:MAG: hypothetical protein LBR53_12670 [Deltaproteobacteria bacterium]|jgi:hypothetical protein|nr:hypothetical protein [Deltaproteobacteria bacterium]